MIPWHSRPPCRDVRHQHRRCLLSSRWTCFSLVVGSLTLSVLQLTMLWHNDHSVCRCQTPSSRYYLWEGRCWRTWGLSSNWHHLWWRLTSPRRSAMWGPSLRTLPRVFAISSSSPCCPIPLSRRWSHPQWPLNFGFWWSSRSPHEACLVACSSYQNICRWSLLSRMPPQDSSLLLGRDVYHKPGWLLSLPRQSSKRDRRDSCIGQLW